MSKPKFNPNQSFEVVDNTSPVKPKFDPTASFDAVTDDEPGMAASATRKLSNSAMMGFGDEIAGGFEAMGRAAGFEGVGGPTKNIKLPEGGWDPTLDWEKIQKAYGTGKTNELNLLKRDADVNPISSGVGDVAGAILSPVNKIGKGLSLAKQGAILGGISGLGNTEADNVADFVQDVGGSAAMNATGAKLLGMAAPVIGKVAGKSKEKAKDFAAKALGLERGTAGKIIRKDGAEKIAELGEYALENNLLSPLSSADDILARNTALKDANLGSRNGYLQQIDDAGASTYNAAQIAEEFQKSFPKPPDYLTNKSTQEAYDKVITDLVSGGNKPSSIQKADELRKIFGDAGKFEAASASPAAKVYQGAYGKLAEGIDKAGVASAKGAGIDPMSVGKLNSQISLGIGAENLLNNAVAKQANQAIGLKDSIFAAPMFAAGDITGGAAVMGLNKAVGRYGNQNAALALQKLGKIDPKVYADFLKKNPGLINKIMPYSLIKTNEESENGN